LRALLAMEATHGRPDAVISRLCAENGLHGRDRAFVSELCHGALRHMRALDFILSHGSGRPAQSMDTPVLAILRMGMYQALGMDRARFAAVNESVELAKSWKKTSRAAGFVNAALRQSLRSIDRAGGKEMTIWEVAKLLQPEGLPPARRLGEQYSFPDYWVARWVENFGEATTERILAGCQAKSPLYIRLNIPVYTSSQVAKLLGDNSIEAKPVAWDEGLLQVTDGVLPPDSPLITDGVVQPQDAASYLASRLLAPGKEDTVADVCCGKGIKSGLFAQLAAKVMAFDLNPSSLISLKKNMARQKIGNVYPILADMTRLWPVRGEFSRIFVDAPCSGSGLARRHPEGKWRKSVELIEKMSRIQSELLAGAVEFLAPGGELVYAICSVEPEEGRDNVEKLLKSDKSLIRVRASARNPRLFDFETETGDMLILPGMHDMDGFFASVIRKK